MTATEVGIWIWLHESSLDSWGGGVVGGGKQGVEGAGKLRNSEESQCGGWYEKIAVTGQLHRPCQFCFVEWKGYFSIVNINIWVNWDT